MPGAAAEPLVAVRGAAVRYGRQPALEDVSLEIAAGESVALIGGNGSGKSTLLRLIHGLVAPCAGSLHAPPPKAQAMVFQRPWMLRASVLHNVAMGLWLRGTPWAEARVHGLAALERVRLGHLAAQSARGLSGGQQQRLALARAWAQQPALLLLDEPTASLDPHAKHRIEALMHEFAEPRDAAMTLVFASHNLGQVKRLARRVVYLEQGRVLADLPVERFFDRAVLRRVAPSADAFLKGEL